MAAAPSNSNLPRHVAIIMDGNGRWAKRRHLPVSAGHRAGVQAVRRIIEEGHDLATRVLREHMDDLHRVSQVLIEHETIDKEQFERLLAGESDDDVFPPPEPVPAVPIIEE